MNRRISIARALITFTAAFLAIVPPIADISVTHIFHPEWTGHARLHTVWLITTNALVSVVAIIWMWRPGVEDVPRAIRRAATLVGCVLLGFFVAGATQGLYGGSFSDPGGVAPAAGGIDANLAAFSVHACIVLVALFLLRTREG